MEVGPSQQYKDLLSIPQSFAGPLQVRLHNEGLPGHPTEYQCHDERMDLALYRSALWADLGERHQRWPEGQ